MAKIGYSIQRLVAKVKDTEANWLIYLYCAENPALYEYHTYACLFTLVGTSNCYDLKVKGSLLFMLGQFLG